MAAGLPSGLGMAHWLVRAATVVLGVLSVVFAVLAVVVPLGQVDLTFHARAQPPYAVGIPGRGEVQVLEDGSVEEVTPTGDDAVDALTEGAPTVGTEVPVGSGDTDARLAVVVLLGLLLALAWLALVKLGGIVEAARSGDPFCEENASRLRWLAAVVFVAPVALAVFARVIDVVVDTPYAVDLSPGSVPWAPCLFAAVALLALAEVFGEGARLREIDRTTI